MALNDILYAAVIEILVFCSSQWAFNSGAKVLIVSSHVLFILLSGCFPPIRIFLACDQCLSYVFNPS